MVHYVQSVEHAAEILKGSNRVMVVGCSGGGKSTLSAKLANRFGLEYQSIDRDVRFLPQWRQRDKQQQRMIIEQLVARDRWVMDGSGPSTFAMRLPRTDLVIWIRMPRLLCLYGVAGRVFRHYGSVRPLMAAGCPEPLPDRDFLAYIWNFEKESAPIFIRNFDLYGPQVPVLVLKSRRDVARLLDLVGAQD
jgi:adenylate kinase family enzyme